MEQKEKIFNVDLPEESTGFLLWQVTNLWQREIKKVLRPYGLTHSQFVLLASILWFSQRKESTTQIQLSEHTKIDPMTTSMVLRTMQRHELIKRRENLKDTRAKTVELTTKGFKIAKLAIKIVEKLDNDFFLVLDNKLKDFNNNIILLLNQKYT